MYINANAKVVFVYNVNFFGAVYSTVTMGSDLPKAKTTFSPFFVHFVLLLARLSVLMLSVGRKIGGRVDGHGRPVTRCLLDLHVAVLIVGPEQPVGHDAIGHHEAGLVHVVWHICPFWRGLCKYSTVTA